MALNIKNAQTERLARELARRRRVGITEAVHQALERDLERERRAPQHGDLVAAVREIAERVSKLPVYDSRSPDEILGYNEHGVWD